MRALRNIIFTSIKEFGKRTHTPVVIFPCRSRWTFQTLKIYVAQATFRCFHPDTFLNLTFASTAQSNMHLLSITNCEAYFMEIILAFVTYICQFFRTLGIQKLSKTVRLKLGDRCSRPCGLWLLIHSSTQA